MFLNLTVQLLEKYKVVKTLGQQKKRKFGEVYLVENRLTGEKAVMKCSIRERHGELAVAQLRNESQFSFNFPELPKIIDQYSSENEEILIFEFCEGEELSSLVKSLKKSEKLVFLQELTKSLIPIFNHLKEKNIVHCDVKDSNLLIHKEDGQLKVTLLDFGIAINTTCLPDRKTLFPLGYAAPELILNHKELIDQRSDIFSLGIIYWKLMAGKLPLLHPNPSIYTNLQLVHPLPEDNSISKDLLKILRRMTVKPQFKTAPNLMNESEVKSELQHAKEARYHNLEEILEDLSRVKVKKFWFSKFPF